MFAFACGETPHRFTLALSDDVLHPVTWQLHHEVVRAVIARGKGATVHWPSQRVWNLDKTWMEGVQEPRGFESGHHATAVSQPLTRGRAPFRTPDLLEYL